jgi:hypothetical protein
MKTAKVQMRQKLILDYFVSAKRSGSIKQNQKEKRAPKWTQTKLTCFHMMLTKAIRPKPFNPKRLNLRQLKITDIFKKI